MENSIPLVGQWLGYFEYGPDYGQELAGERVQFRLFVDKVRNGKFEGRIADLEGIGSDFDVTPVKGFIREEFISFIKEYNARYEIDEEGISNVDESQPPITVHYEGTYDRKTKMFLGEWDLDTEVETSALKKETLISTGTWNMWKDD